MSFIEEYFLLVLFLISLGINLLFFLIAYALRKDWFTDITYALTFMVLSTSSLIFTTLQYKQISVIQIITYVLVIIWSIRIGLYLFIRILKIKYDRRFDNMRDVFWKFLGFWVLQAISCYVISLPANIFISLNPDKVYNFSLINILFIFLWLDGFILETIADQQKQMFFKNRKPDELFIKTGFWKYSRHPNYFGELEQWWSIWAILIFNVLYKDYQNQDLYYLISILSPLFLNVLLLFVSGIPLLERNLYLQVKHPNEEYNTYIKKTSTLVPWIGKKGHIMRVKKLIKNQEINNVDKKPEIESNEEEIEN